MGRTWYKVKPTLSSFYLWPAKHINILNLQKRYDKTNQMFAYTILMSIN